MDLLTVLVSEEELKETPPPRTHVYPPPHTHTPGRTEQQGLVPTCPTVEPEALSPPLEVMSPSQCPGFAVFAFASFQAPLEHFSLQTGSGNCWNRTESSLIRTASDRIPQLTGSTSAGTHLEPVLTSDRSHVRLGRTSHWVPPQTSSHVSLGLTSDWVLLHTGSLLKPVPASD